MEKVMIKLKKIVWAWKMSSRKLTNTFLNLKKYHKNFFIFKFFYYIVNKKLIQNKFHKEGFSN